MTLADMATIARAATEAGCGIGAFNVICLEHAEAFAAAATAADRPVILQVSENAVRYHGSPRPILLASLAIAEECAAPAVVHLDHAESEDLVDEALRIGVRSVMFDASKSAPADNVARTAAVRRRVHAVGGWIEAELGEIGGKDGVHAPGVRTDPGEATQFVADTGVDALAVAVGSSHAMTRRTSVLDNDLIARLADAVDVPLVLHGSSGVPDDGLRSAVAAGMRKINIATHLNAVLTDAVRARLAHGPVVDPRKYLGDGRDAMSTEVAQLLQLLAPAPYLS